MGGEFTVFQARVIDGQTAQDSAGAIGPARMSQVRESTWYVKFSAGSSAGAVVIEAAANEADTDTWANVGTVNWAAASRTHYVSVTGVHLAMRARISTAITGGTVDVDVVGR